MSAWICLTSQSNNEMAYSTDDIKALAAILKPIIKSALESGSTGVGDLEVVTSLDSVYSLPALRMPGGIHDVVEAPLSLLRVNLRVTTTHVQWKLGNGEWKDLLALSELKVVFRRTEKHLQWKVGAGSWEDIVELESLKGEKGDRGNAFRYEDFTLEQLMGLKGDKGDKGDNLEYRLLDSFPSLEALRAAYPTGTGQDGFFIAGDGMYVWDPKDVAYKEIKLEVDKVFTSEIFREVTPSGGRIAIDFLKAPYAKVALGQDTLIYNLEIQNTREGSCGKVMVYQSGLRQIVLSNTMRGTIDLPLNSDTIAILNYNRVGEYIYIHTSTIIGDKTYPGPQKIKDFHVVYSDSSSCTVQWTAPYANNIYDRGTEYDMRYANDLVDADDPKVWAGLRKVPAIPTPENPGTLQRTTISGLVPNREYYVYLKTIKVNFGVEYISGASDPVYFRTVGSEDMTRAYRINLTERNIIPQLRNYLTDTDGTVCSVGRMVDETERNVFLEDGYPDTTNKDYSTFWSQYKYGRDTSPFDIIIDLYSVYSIDKMFVYSRSKPRFSAYGMLDQGYDWEKIGQISIVNNDWASLDFHSSRYRFVKISFDMMDFGSSSTSPVMPEGTEAFPDPEYNGTIERIDNLLIYGRPTSSRPEGIMSPLRRSTARKTVDQFFCTNGHGYQQGRIHSMCSGERMRMYIHFGHFAANYGTENAYSSLSDMRFKVNKVDWVSGNNGTGEYLEDTLRNTYLRYGLKPFLCNTGVFDYCIYDKTVSSHNRPCDNYWYPDAWRAVPKRGVGGLDKYFGATCDPMNYRTYAKLCTAIAAKYGKNKIDGAGLFFPESESLSTGLDLISGIEPENEPDQNWSGWVGYTHSEEYAAMLSAACDGHDSSLVDEEGNVLPGIKSGGVLGISAGTASVNKAYYLAAMLRWKAERKSANIPVDVFSMHMYFSNIGNQGSSQEKVQYGITFEEAIKNVTGGELVKMVELRDRFAPDKEIALTEFGWGESGGREKSCKYQCYTQAGRQIGSWTIPDRHRSDVKGAWIVRACIQMMSIGIDFVNYYSTECESNYFDAGQWGTGAGFEMFHWDDCKDTTPGAKAAAIKAFEHGFDRGGFATTGLFGQILTNGAYPITRAYWWIATFRNRLKGYVYTGMKYIGGDERIVVACFKKQGEDKGAYAVYLNDNKNTGVEGVEIPVPSGVDLVKHVTVYVPNIPNPQDVPSDLGWDQRRSGLPTSRKERYVNGEWVLLNKPYMGDKYSSYTQSPASYPESPAEGDEITTLPTAEENPYYPIVGPVCAKSLVHGNSLSAQQYEQDREEWETEPNLDDNGNVIWTVKGNIALAWRQVDAVCDYIDLHPEGAHGRNGDEVTEPTIRGMIRANVSEFPEYFFFDAVPEPDYRSEITDLSSKTVSSSAIELWWNNTNTEDTGYEIFVSGLPETGYTPLKTVGVGVENKAVISGLSPDTTYYYKIRPVRGDKTGTMSDYTSVRTFSELPAPDNLRVQGRTATSITLSWAYTNEQVADFVYYAVLRSDGTGSFLQVGKVDDKSVLTYMDSGLIVGHNYTYKVRAVGLNGQSAYAPELETRTLLAEECSPVVRYAMTDKLGSKVALTFDLPIGAIEASAKAKFTLTEDGSLRLINYVARDEANHNNLILNIPQDSLKDYDAKTDIRITFTGGSIYSEYGVELAAFSDVKVVNIIGNFTNIEAIYKLNFCSSTAPLPADTEWNNIVGNPEADALSVKLQDSYGRASNIILSPVQNKPQYNWGSPVESGYCEIPGIEAAVYKYVWRGPGFGANNSENMVARLKFSGLNDEYRYTFKAFGATTYGADLLTRIKINGIYSETINLKGNKTSYLTIEDRQPSSGIIYVDIVNATEGANTSYPILAFMMLEEYKSNDAPENTDVFLREATVTEAVDGIVKSPDVTVHLNCIGAALSYRISENQSIDEVKWMDMIDDNMNIPFTLSSGFGNKTLYTQVKNLYSVSNIRVTELEYKDPYVPLALRNVFINEDAGKTYDREVSVMVDKDGVPSHYKISENPDLATAQWLAWPSPKLSVIPFTLSNGAGQKTVYVQIMDSTTICEAKADTINYAPIERGNIELTITLPDGVDANAVTAQFPVLKYNKKFIFTYTADDGPVGAYGKVWSAVNKKWVDDEKYYHIGQAKSSGYVPEKTLGYTDGCGVEHRLPVGVAIWPNCGSTIKYMDDDPKSPAQYPYIIWKELPPILDFGGEIYFHNIDQDKWGKDDPLRILEGLKEDQAKTIAKLGCGMKVMMRPDGNNNYITAATMYDVVAMSFAENTPAVYLYPSDDPDLHKSVGQRKMYTDDNTAEMEWIRGIHDSDNPVWAHLFTHTPGQAILDFLTAVNDAYGKDGDDSVWMATVDEVYEYWFVRKNTIIKRAVSGSTVTFLLSVPVDPMFYHRDLSLRIEGVPGMEGLRVDTNDAVLGLSYGVKDGGLLVNINYDERTVERAGRYTALFESSVLEGDRDDAMYFLSHLRESVARPYMDRITVAMRPPVLLSFSVPMESMSTSFSCSYTSTGTASHYMISESADFSGAEWEVITETVTYTIQGEIGGHTLYFKLKNTFGESVAMSGIVNYKPMVVGGKVIVSLSNPSNNGVAYDIVGGEVVNYISPVTYNGWTTNTLRDVAGNDCCAYQKKKDDYPGIENTDYVSVNNSLFAPDNIDDSGAYPAKYITRHICNGKSNTGIPAVLRFTGITLGTYRLRILVSCSSGGDIDASMYGSMFYSGNNVTAHPTSSPVNNMTRFIEIDGVPVIDDGILDVKIWNTAGAYNRPGLNLIEIERL